MSRVLVVRPGTASCLSRNSGTQKEWITSLAVIWNSTGRSFGSIRVLDRIGLPMPSCGGYSKDQVNCCPVTLTTRVLGCLASMSSSTIQP